MDQRIDTSRDDPVLAQLERQVERSQLFTHSALGENSAWIGETSVFVHGLIDLLLAKGVVTEDELRSAAAQVRRQMAEQGELAGPGTVVRLEEESPGPVASPVPVDCETRMPVCSAVCCKLNFALTVGEIESGLVKWDLGRPYYIRHETDGYCVHIDRKNNRCRVYLHRPGVCRRYSCAGDTRIWTDFEKMELNTAWLTANLPPDMPERRVGALMERLGGNIHFLKRSGSGDETTASGHCPSAPTPDERTGNNVEREK